jgi:hypothetical protein
MSMNVANELRDHLDEFEQFMRTLGNTNKHLYIWILLKDRSNLGEHDPNNLQSTEDGRLRSALITRDDRKYYVDLKENERGRFLRVCGIFSNLFCKSISFIII